MASIGHIAVGMAAARVHRPLVDDAAPRWSSMAWWSALSLLPDADVIGFSFGVRYADPWGHRGATHSIVFALALAAAIGLAAPKFQLPRRRTWLIASVVLVSHGLLDTLTDGGLGCALLWPFDLTRYFAPWQPIPVAPIGLYFFSRYGLFVSLTELILFAPLVLFALRRTRTMRFVFPAWGAMVWLVVSGDPIREAILGVVLRENTEYANGFSDRSFRAIRLGQSDTEVRRRVGAPIGEWWDYVDPESSAANVESGCPFVYFESDRIITEDQFEPVVALCAQRGIRAGMSRAEVLRVLGPPLQVCSRYTRSPAHRYHRARVVCFSNGKVVTILRRWESN
jgi:inner membrane protein